MATVAKSNPGQFALLNAARGFACLWVVAHHALGFMAVADPVLAANPRYTFVLNGALGVWIFFVISGYCIANTAVRAFASEGAGWAVARVRRIYPPCWFSALLVVASALLARTLVLLKVLPSSHLADNDFLGQSWSYYAANLTLTQELFRQPSLSGVYWTLCYEVGFYALVGLALFTCRGRLSVRAMLNGLHTLTLACVASLLLWPAHGIFPFDLWPHFGLGVLVYDLLAHGWRRAGAFLGLTLAGLISFCLLYPVRYALVDRGGWASFATSMSTAVALLALYRFDAWLAKNALLRLLSWLGVFSYSLYLTHVVVIGYVYKASQMAGLVPRFLPLYLLVTAVICVAVARLFFHFCERPFLTTRLRRAEQVAEAALRTPVTA